VKKPKDGKRGSKWESCFGVFLKPRRGVKILLIEHKGGGERSHNGDATKKTPSSEGEKNPRNE